jgi:TnpA family transposase
VVEHWKATNDFICYSRQGELATNSREQQEIVTLSLQLLQNYLMLINTLLLERTIERDGLMGAPQRGGSAGLDPAVPRAHRSPCLR